MLVGLVNTPRGVDKILNGTQETDVVSPLELGLGANKKQKKMNEVYLQITIQTVVIISK